jgi:phosphatidate cytidylyltransferase
VLAVLFLDWRTKQAIAVPVLVWAVMVLSLAELYRMAAVTRAYGLWGVLSLTALAASPWVSRVSGVGELEWSAVALVASLVGLLLLDWAQGGIGRGLESVGVPLLGVVYLWGCLSFVARTEALPGAGVGGVALLFAVAKGSDIAAYYAGTRLGRHRLAPRVSPKKSVEGAAGALVASLLIAVGVVRLLGLPFGLGQAALFGGVVGLAGQAGDLAESFLKRKLRCKDSAQLLPGFGGVLDLADSLAGSAPVAYVMFRLLG